MHIVLKVFFKGIAKNLSDAVIWIFRGAFNNSVGR